MKAATLLAKLFERLRALGMGERVLKTTLAVILAWEIGLRLPGGTEHPYFVPLGALLSFQVTIADSITAAFQRVVGIVAGVVVALVVSRITGQTALGAGLLVFLALVVGANLRLTQQGVAQVATSALIVMIVGGTDPAGGRIGLLQPATLAALGGLLAALAEAIWSVTDNEVPDRGEAALQKALETIGARRHEVAQAAATQSPALTSDAWMHLGAILAIADRMRTDLSRSAETTSAVSELAEI